MAEIGPNQEQQRKPGWRKRKSTAGKLLGTLIGVVVLIVLIGLVVLVTGCGGLATATTAAVSTTITTTSEKYEGTWIQKEQLGGSTETPIIIKKVGDQYAVTGPGGETYGYMLH